MNTQIRPPRIGPQPWEQVRGKLDQSLPFANMRDTPYYRDCGVGAILQGRIRAPL